MKQYFAPLGIFVFGNIVLLLIFLFFPAIGTTQTSLESDISAVASNFWGLSWVVASTRVIIVLVVEGLVLFAVAKSILGLRN